MPVSLRVYAYHVLSYVELFEDTRTVLIVVIANFFCEPRNLTICFSSA